MAWTRASVRLNAVAGLMALAVLTGCTGSPDPVPTSSSSATSVGPGPSVLTGWQRVTLPASMRASSIALAGRSIVVGGHLGSGTDRVPAMAWADAGDRRFRASQVRPRSPYGAVADLISVTAAGSSVVVLGAAHGGAHANFRWTIWSGSPKRIVDRPQRFDAFGGEEAGGLLDVAWDSAGPMIVGTWQGERGLDGRIWRVADERWTRQAPVAALTDTATRQVAPRAAENRHGATVISGSVIELAGGVRQSAAIWRGAGSQWALTLLPDPGRRSEAWSTECAAACATLGSRDGAAAVWENGTRMPVPELAVDDHDNGVIMVGGDLTVAALSSAGRGRLLVGRAGRWSSYTAPDGVVASALLVGSRLYVVSDLDGGTLWTHDLADLLSR